MIIKKYVVSDMREAIIRAKYELGREAVIISQRKVKDGKWFIPFKKNKLEVTVAIEEDIAKENPLKNNKNYISSKNENKNTSGIFTNLSDNSRQKLSNYCKLHKKNQDDLIQENLREFILENFKNNCFEKKIEFSKINAFIGPTGVGKTTTIAKIASNEYLVNKKKVGLITMDTYRIGAVEQLKTYANILGIPCETVERPQEMEKKIDKLSYCDIILIDTVGTSQKNTDKMDDIYKYLNAISEDMNKYLVLSISTEKETTLSILDKYKKLNYNAIILTKFDEVNTFHNFWNLLENNKMPVQFFCFGQDVPEDIKKASIDNVISFLWGELV
ncbi:MAG: hypothetical protein ACOWWH_08375 [Eubacteriaceae bacterium]